MLMCRKRHSKVSETTREDLDPTYEVSADPTYELADFSPSSDNNLQMKQNSAYGQTGSAQLEVNENISYGVLHC